MARRCAICGKTTQTGRAISHAHNVTSRTWKPNLQKVRVTIDGKTRRVSVCARCLRTGKVKKPRARDWKPEAPAASPPEQS